MVIRREWVIVCHCPDCGKSMAPLVQIQEQHYPEAHNMPAHTYLSSTMYGMGIEQIRCDPCGVVHDVTRLEPSLVRVDL